MAVYTIQDTTLTDIAGAIREKTGKTDLIAPGDMPAEIASITTGGGGEVEPIVLTGNCERACVGTLAQSFITNFSNKISTDKITSAYYMFQYYPYETIPFDLNFDSNNNQQNLNYMFCYSQYLTEVPKMTGVQPQQISYMFNNCQRLRYLPDNFGADWDWDFFHSHSGDIGNIFSECYSLRAIPKSFMEHMYNQQAASYNGTYYNQFLNCYVLDEICGVPVISKELTSNVMNSSLFSGCRRAKNITFSVNEDGTPKTAQWKNQVLTLTNSVGYVGGDYFAHTMTTDYNSGITPDKMVNSDDTYQALKNDPDWFATSYLYSRYNHDSAVATINSLPDTSAYLAEKGGTNTIKFQGSEGAATDGGAINTLTEEEIAVAVAKGWTVSLN